MNVMCHLRYARLPDQCVPVASYSLLAAPRLLPLIECAALPYASLLLGAAATFTVRITCARARERILKRPISYVSIHRNA